MSLVLNGDTGVSMVQTGAVTFEDMPAGSVIQVANYTTGTMATGTEIIPYDNTIPQITEGTQFMSLAFTPKKANSKLLVTTTVNGTASVNSVIIVAFIKDTATDAVASVGKYSVAGAPDCITFSTYITVSSLSAITFSVRVGLSVAGSIYFNGYTGLGVFGGALASSITIEEIAQ